MKNDIDLKNKKLKSFIKYIPKFVLPFLILIIGIFSKNMFSTIACLLASSILTVASIDGILKQKLKELKKEKNTTQTFDYKTPTNTKTINKFKEKESDYNNIKEDNFLNN